MPEWEVCEKHKLYTYCLKLRNAFRDICNSFCDRICEREEQDDRENDGEPEQEDNNADFYNNEGHYESVSSEEYVLYSQTDLSNFYWKCSEINFMINLKVLDLLVGSGSVVVCAALI